MNPPCKNCPDRCADPNCHDSCEKYKIWKQEYNVKREREKQRKGVYRPPHGGYNPRHDYFKRIKGDQ